MAGKKSTGYIDQASGIQRAGKLIFHYIKSNYFRVIHADGVFGGISPKGKIQLAFFSERQPLPQQTVFEFDAKKGVIAEEIDDERVTRKGIVREIETNVVMDLDTAKIFSSWLQEKITELEILEVNSAKETKGASQRAKK